MIHEPMTLATDWILGGLWIVLGRRLVRQGRASGATAVTVFGAAFLAMGVAALAGGTVHGFPEALGPVMTAGLWTITLHAIGLGSGLFLLAALRATGSAAAWRVGRMTVGAGLLVYVGWTLRHDAFTAAIVVSVPVMLAVIVLLGRRGHREIVAGMVVALLAAGVQRSGVALHRHFNHNDLYHVVQMVSVVLLYRGGRWLGRSGEE